MNLLEHDIQNKIRLAISESRLATCFRANVGEAWTGQEVRRNQDGSITISRPRRFQTGLPNGFSDLLCVVPAIITADMVGATIGRAGFVEIKTERGRVSPAQKNFLEQMAALGALAGVARTPEDAIKILQGKE